MIVVHLNPVVHPHSTFQLEQYTIAHSFNAFNRHYTYFVIVMASTKDSMGFQ